MGFYTKECLNTKTRSQSDLKKRRLCLQKIENFIPYRLDG